MSPYPTRRTPKASVAKPRSRKGSGSSKNRPLAIRPVPVPVNAHHPPVPFREVLPQHEFSIGIVAPKGSGKTTLIINLLDMYAGYFHMITVFSPTIHADDKWDYVRKRPYLAENKALKAFLEKQSKGNPVVGGPWGDDEGRRAKEEHVPQIPDDQFMTDYDESTLQALMDEQDDMVKKVKSMGGGKHLCNRWLIIFDDQVGSSLFSGKAKNPFKILSSNQRHYSASVLEVTQAYKEFPKTVRTNFSCLVLFEIPNESEVKVIYEENPLGMKREVWEQVYRHCTGEEYAFMYVNYQRPKQLRIMKNFQSFVYQGEEQEAA
jgi:hypothetical protein